MTFPYKEGRTGYQIFITGNDNIQQFAAHIGVHFLSAGRKASCSGWLCPNRSTPAAKMSCP